MNVRWAKSSGTLREAIVARRAQLKREIVDEVGSLCECCNFQPATDLHEVFVLRSAVPLDRQLKIFVRSNCALVCRACHDGPAQLAPFKERFTKRLIRLGHSAPFTLEG